MQQLAKKVTRWTSMLALAATGLNAAAQATDAPVWIANDSFGFETCAATTRHMSDTDVDAVLASARALASNEITQSLRMSGLAFGGDRFTTLTPVSGSMACGATDTQVVFRVTAIDRTSGKFFTTELAVRGSVATASQQRLSEMLAGQFGGMVVAKAR